MAHNLKTTSCRRETQNQFFEGKMVVLLTRPRTVRFNSGFLGRPPPPQVTEFSKNEKYYF